MRRAVRAAHSGDINGRPGRRKDPFTSPETGRWRSRDGNVRAGRLTEPFTSPETGRGSVAVRSRHLNARMERQTDPFASPKARQRRSRNANRRPGGADGTDWVTGSKRGSGAVRRTVRTAHSGDINGRPARRKDPFASSEAGRENSCHANGRPRRRKEPFASSDTGADPAPCVAQHARDELP